MSPSDLGNIFKLEVNQIVVVVFIVVGTLAVVALRELWRE